MVQTSQPLYVSKYYDTNIKMGRNYFEKLKRRSTFCLYFDLKPAERQRKII